MDLNLDIGTSPLDALSIKAVDFNVSEFSVSQVGEDADVTSLSDPVYEQFLADVWVGIVLTLMVLSCVCFMCSCLIYHKIQEWKHRELSPHGNLEAGIPEVDLPSYTIASGLPTYEEALEQLKRVQEKTREAQQVRTTGGAQEATNEIRTQGRGHGQSGTLSMFNLFGITKNGGESSATKPT
ncbi:protein commissureless 2 homolog [Euwallacea fornicatus]|uniref:protein commissureless 2 homolog n=1 Tax=Euwallacea fornicatus TaxID=995702 RepID=UPI00338F4B13